MIEIVTSTELIGLSPFTAFEAQSQFQITNLIENISRKVENTEKIKKWKTKMMSKYLKEIRLY